jgi:hypothetical protein
MLLFQLKAKYPFNNQKQQAADSILLPICNCKGANRGTAALLSKKQRQQQLWQYEENEIDHSNSLMSTTEKFRLLRAK